MEQSSRATSLFLFFTVASILLATLAIALSCAAFGAMRQQQNGLDGSSIAVSGAPEEAPSGTSDGAVPQEPSEAPPVASDEAASVVTPAPYTVRLVTQTDKDDPLQAHVGIYDSAGELIDRQPLPWVTLLEQDRAALSSGIEAQTYAAARRLVGDFCN